jgi:lysyl-tRNA synthetase class 2
MYESIQKYTGIDVSAMTEDDLLQTCKDLGIETDSTMGRGKLVDEIFSDKVEANLIQPTFITDYPIEMTPLAKKHRSVEGLVERFEIFVNGKEIGNAYSELNDPIDQKERFVDQLKLADRGDAEAMAMDSLEYGMPPTSGLGFGIDRIVMLMTNQSTIQEVLFFPQMRPEKKKVEMNADEAALFAVVTEGENHLLASVKEKLTDWSNKKWDTTLKSLTTKGILKVTKTDDGLFISHK